MSQEYKGSKGNPDIRQFRKSLGTAMFAMYLECFMLLAGWFPAIYVATITSSM
jgi:hypothetical protein